MSLLFVFSCCYTLFFTNNISFAFGCILIVLLSWEVSFLGLNVNI